jgi:hypothetical protein
VGRPIEEAITEGRQAIYSLSPKGEDWSNPVLFLRPSSDGLFAFQEGRRPLRRLWLWPTAAALLLIMASAAGLILRDRDFSEPKLELPEPELRKTVRGSMAGAKKSAPPQPDRERTTTASDDTGEPPTSKQSPATSALPSTQGPSVSSPVDVEKKPPAPVPADRAPGLGIHRLEENNPLRLQEIGVTLSVQFSEVQGVELTTLTISTKEGTRREPILNPGKEFLLSSDPRPVRVIVHGIQESEKILTLEISSP